LGTRGKPRNPVSRWPDMNKFLFPAADQESAQMCYEIYPFLMYVGYGRKYEDTLPLQFGTSILSSYFQQRWLSWYSGGLDGRGIGIPFPAGAVLPTVQTGSAAPSSLQRNTEWRIKRSGREPDHSPLSSAESYTPTPPLFIPC
jgi:hypothetical protein